MLHYRKHEFCCKGCLQHKSGCCFLQDFQSTWESSCKNLKTVFCPLTWESPCTKPCALQLLDPIDMGIPMSKTTPFTAFGCNRHGNPHVKNLPPYSFWVQLTWESPCQKPSPLTAFGSNWHGNPHVKNLPALQLLGPIDMVFTMSKTFPLKAFGSNRHGNPDVKNLPPWQLLGPIDMGIPMSRTFALQLLGPIDMGIPM